MNRKTLYMQDPIVSTYTSYGSLFSIIQDKMWPWVFNNFIQIRYARGWKIYAFDNHHMFLSNCPNIAYYILPQGIIINKWNKSLKELIIDSVNSDYYLFLYVDRYYISKSDYYLNYHFPHEIFIYGYDLEKDIVYIADNLQGGKFIKTECSFEEIENGYWHVKGDYTFLIDVRLLKLKDDISSNFDLEQVRLGLDSYLHSKRTVDLLDEQKCDFGFDAINRLFWELENQSKEKAEIDIRPFHLLYEHKILMEMRVKYMVEQGYILDNCNLIRNLSDLKNDYFSLRNMLIKINIKRDSKMMRDIINKFQLNIITEKSLITNLLQTITSSTPI
ncbi:hypothetical protein [Ruminiclostridium cellobioparum]|uniref:hypothetical protein n=1 Tax=Ruminiclostridium cellobioparum TaxID=29355 RepID=UPI0004845FE6|nr:hypothetical protein [Ruminiclostridium cellobioparum]